MTDPIPEPRDLTDGPEVEGAVCYEPCDWGRCEWDRDRQACREHERETDAEQRADVERER